MHPRKRKPSTKAGQIKAALTRLSGRRVDSFGHPIALLTQSASNVYKVSGYFMAALDDRLLGSGCCPPRSAVAFPVTVIRRSLVEAKMH